jgi:hypothetical protein
VTIVKTLKQFGFEDCSGGNPSFKCWRSIGNFGDDFPDSIEFEREYNAEKKIYGDFVVSFKKESYTIPILTCELLQAVILKLNEINKK